MKDFVKMLLASMLGFTIMAVVLFFISIALIIAVVSISSSDEVSIPSKSVLYIRLDDPIAERAPKNPIFVDFETMSRQAGLDNILNNIKKAREDENISGIFLEISSVYAGISTINEIRNTLLDFKKSGKFIYSYSEDYSQGAYFLATVSDKIYLNPEGSLMFKGLNAELFFLKGLLSKLDIQIQVVRHGKFKSATEPFFLDKMSPENREQITALVNATWGNILNGISEARNIPVDQLNRFADSLLISTPANALKYHFIDQVAYKDEVLSDLKKKTGVEEKGKISFVSLDKYGKVPEQKKEKTRAKDKIAIIYASGDIVSGDETDTKIGSEEMSKTIRKAREDENVKAIVLRVNSPGGSALASEVIWREVSLAAAVKPVVASLGDVAASGGYYIVCPATKIFADPSTLTGSIGVFGMIPNLKGMFNDKLGVTFDNVKSNANSDYISVNAPMPAYQTKVLQNEIEKIYDTFITHVANGRKLKKEFVDSIGQGRVWAATDAKKIGLIDDFGGIDKAVEGAAELAKIKDYKRVELPEQKDIFTRLIDELTGNTRISILERELGNNYRYYEYLKQVQEMQGIQARLPFLMDIE